MRAASEQEALNKAQEFALDYERTSSWRVRKVVEVNEIVDAKVGDGVEVYSAFISQEWADVLMKGSTSPLAEWKKQNPGKDPDDATVQEIADAWDSRDS